MNKYFKRVNLASACVILLASCAPDLREDVTKNPDAKVEMEELQPWPKPDSDGIFLFDNRRYVEVRYGETLYDVAKRADEDPLVVAELNQISPDSSLQAGKVLQLPPRKLNSDGLATTGYVVGELDKPDFEIDISGKTENYYRHRVRKGETAYTIAQLYDISVRTLADWNELGADFALMEGEILIIPATNQVKTANVEESPTPEPAPSTDSVIEEPAKTITEVPVAEAEVKPVAEETRQVVAEPKPAEDKVVTEPKLPAKIDCNNFEPAQFGFSSPLNGELIQDYSDQPGENKGIDISAPVGSQVFAVGKGKIALISDLAEGSKVLLILHECNVFSIYQNLQDITLERGDFVEESQQIGILDSEIGFLHFEIRVGPDSTDPKRYLPSNSYSN